MRSFAPVGFRGNTMMPEQSGSASAPGAPRVAPHPLLKSYYADEPGRKRRVNEMFDSSAPHGPDELTKLPMTYLSIIVYTRD